jgi:hypothetical protein
MTHPETPLLNDRQARLTAMRQQAMACTLSHDWHCEPGNEGAMPKYSPVRSGWEKMAALFGVSLSMRGCECKDYHNKDGDLIRFTYTARVTALFKSPVVADQVTVDEEGTAASDHKLLSKGGKLDAKKVDEGSIQKTSITNAYGRAVTALLGLGDVTKDELIAAGVDVSTITQTERKSHSDDSGQGGKPQITQAKADSIKQEIQQILKVLASARTQTLYPDTAKEDMPDLATEQYMILCKTVTEWVKADGTIGRPGVDSLKKLPNHVSPHVLSAAKALYQTETGHVWAGGQS